MQQYIKILLLLSVVQAIHGGSFKPLEQEDYTLIESFYKDQSFVSIRSSSHIGVKIGVKIVSLALLGALTIEESFSNLSPIQGVGMFSGIYFTLAGLGGFRALKTLSSVGSHFTKNNFSDTLDRIKQANMSSVIEVSLSELHTLYKAQAVGADKAFSQRVKNLLAYKVKLLRPLKQKFMEGAHIEGEERPPLPPEMVKHIFNYIKYPLRLEELLPLQKTFWYAQKPTDKEVQFIEYKSEDDRNILKLKKSPLTQALALTYPLVYDPKTGYQAGTDTFI